MLNPEHIPQTLLLHAKFTFSFSTQQEDMNIECKSYKRTSYSPQNSCQWPKKTGKMAFNEGSGVKTTHLSSSEALPNKAPTLDI